MNEFSDGFEHYQVYILEQIKRLDLNVSNSQEQMLDIIQTLGEIKTDIGILKVKSGIWGLIAGAISAIGVFIAKATYWGGSLK